jgi:hypothetical protein
MKAKVLNPRLRIKIFYAAAALSNSCLLTSLRLRKVTISVLLFHLLIKKTSQDPGQLMAEGLHDLARNSVTFTLTGRLQSMLSYLHTLRVKY